MAALRWLRSVAGAVKGEEGLPQPGARGQHGDGAPRDRLAMLEHVQFVWVQMRNSCRRRHQVVNEPDVPEAQSPDEVWFPQTPGQIGQLGFSGGNRAGHVET